VRRTFKDLPLFRQARAAEFTLDIGGGDGGVIKQFFTDRRLLWFYMHKKYGKNLMKFKIVSFLCNKGENPGVRKLKTREIFRKKFGFWRIQPCTAQGFLNI
jgi:hypothetical protein